MAMGWLPKSWWVCVLGGRDVLDTAQRASSFLLLLHLQLSENLQKDLHWRCGFARKHSRPLAACKYTGNNNFMTWWGSRFHHHEEEQIPQWLWRMTVLRPWTYQISTSSSCHSAPSRPAFSCFYVTLCTGNVRTLIIKILNFLQFFSFHSFEWTIDTRVVIYW